MNRTEAERLITAWTKPLYGFALRRCANTQDAEDLTQDICLKLFRTLPGRDDIESEEFYVWTVARHTLANYYRDRQAFAVGLPPEDIADILPGRGDDPAEAVAEAETVGRLHAEIARLSRLQRNIVIAYYYEGLKQEAIAAKFGLPCGTVKWHLFEAKKELKKGMDSMRTNSEQAFNPIRFELCGFNGSVGTKGGPEAFFRSALSQNIVYSAWKSPKTVNEIADALGVSPVYVENEAEYLEEYGFLIRRGGRYLCNILLDEPTTALHRLQSHMYAEAAKRFAGPLADRLLNSGLLEGEGLYLPHQDQNFSLWALIPYITAYSGDKNQEASISFEDAATVRPDGGQNICYASVLAPGVEPPQHFDSMKRWFGPCWNANEAVTLFQVDSEWSGRRIDGRYSQTVGRDLTLLERFAAGQKLHAEDTAYLAERGYLTQEKGETILQIVQIRDAETKKKLMKIGDDLKNELDAELHALKEPVIQAVLEATPVHLQKMQKYGLQYIFFADGWFLLHCLKELVGSGRLQPPEGDRKKALSILLLPNT